MGLRRSPVLLSVRVTLDAPKGKPISQEVQSIVSHPLEFAGDGGGRSRLDGVVGQPPSVIEHREWIRLVNCVEVLHKLLNLVLCKKS